MSLSYASILAAFIQCFIILMLMQLLLKFESQKIYISPQFLYGIGLLFFIRLILPVEFGFSLTIPSTNVLPRIKELLKFHLFNINQWNVTLGNFLIVICLLGVGYKLTTFLYKNILLVRYIRSQKISKQTMTLLNNKQTEISFIQSQQVTSPAIYGIKNPVIFLPSDLSFSEKELKYIVLHEMTHYRKKDALVTLAFELLTIFYWWNPLLFVFKKQMNKVMELRVDNELLKQFNSRQCIEYVECLLKVKKEQQNKKRKQFLIAPTFLNKSRSTFELRVKKILNFKPIKATNKIIFLFTLLLSFSSLIFIIEPSSVDPQTKATTFEIDKKDKNFLIKQSDGTFSLYIDNQFKANIDDIDAFPDADKLTIYTPDQIPSRKTN